MGHGKSEAICLRSRTGGQSQQPAMIDLEFPLNTYMVRNTMFTRSMLRDTWTVYFKPLNTCE